MIITDPEILHQKSALAKQDEIGPIIEKLELELEHSAKLGRPGIGLAAIQINIPKQVAIIRLGNEKINLVNCKIEKGFDETIFENEGCLSIPGKSFDTKRYQEIYVIENEVYPHSFIATGLFAVVVQHELSHNNGVLISDISIEKQIGNKLGPNEKCYCGSGLKFKKCHKGK